VTGTDLPLWAAALVVALALLGGMLVVIGSFGMLRLRSFYERAHPATIAPTMGASSILLASLLYFSLVEGRFMPKALLVMVFIPLVNPVTAMLLARAALSRDRSLAFGARVQVGDADIEQQRKARELAEAMEEAARRPPGRGSAARPPDPSEDTP